MSDVDKRKDDDIVRINETFSYKRTHSKVEVYKDGKVWKIFYNDPFIMAITENKK